jgi:Cu+-exporting ATPase
MDFTYTIAGMHCGGCVARVKKALQPLADEVEVTLEPPQARLVADGPLDLAMVRAAVAGAGRYTVEPAAA